MPNTRTPRDVALGCRLNAYEGAAMRALADAAGLANATIVNTCAVTAAAARESRAAVRRAGRRGPVIVTGCAAALEPGAFAALGPAVRVLDNTAKLDPATWGLAPGQVPEPAAQDRARPIVQVQGGCDHACTFCVTTIARGAATSVTPEEVARRVAMAVDAGAREVVLSGVDIASWAHGRARLGDLVAHVLRAVPALGRVRLSSLDPGAMDATVWQLIESEPRLAPHLHLSVQAGDDMVLTRMRRRHRRADILEIAARARAARPGIALGADLIAGFPTEDDAMFARTLALVEEAGLAYAHVFAYSPRPGTAAAKMPQVPGAVIKRRAAALRAQAARAQHRFVCGLVGTQADVVVEGDGRTGRTGHFVPVVLDAPGAPGAMVRARLGAVLDGGRMAACAA
jgi:threonylcarbamoyladenosine tRNA methylthiotransferase MtaB